MNENDRIYCRMVACRETQADDHNSWSFYFVNDGLVPLDSVTLCRVSWEYGDIPRSDNVAVQVVELAPKAAVRLWRDYGDLRTELQVTVCLAGREAQLSFEFPRFSRQSVWPMVDVLGRPGLEVAAEG